MMPQSNKRKFQLPDVQRQDGLQARKIPRAARLRVGLMDSLPIPERIHNKFVPASRYIVGIDIETHDMNLGRRLRWWRGPHGFPNLTDPETFKRARIVQIGWAIVDERGDVKSSQRIIQPSGFQITKDASDYHKITQAKAEESGVKFMDAITDFFTDLANLNSSYRVVAHHLEFDAGIIIEELSRCGRKDRAVQFAEIVKAGVCTMDPSIAKWYRELVGDEPVEHCSALKLTVMAKRLLPTRSDLMERKNDAEADAEMVALVYAEMRKRAILS